MRYAVMSDIHGNLTALDRALEFAQSQSYDALVCLGDIVGYGAEPNRCCERIRDIADVIIIGNHDNAAVGNMKMDYFNVYAREALQWTMNELKPSCKSFLSTCSFTADIDDALCVHASPYEPENWHYVTSRIDALAAFQAFSKKICFIGHSHYPLLAIENGNKIVLQSVPPNMNFKDNQRYIVNVGSVGQPRDGDPRACVGLYDSTAKTYEFFRLDYDINKAQHHMQQKGLPAFLISRLEKGY